MNHDETLKITIEEFTRLQRYMLLLSDQDQAAYAEMYDRYTELKVILTSLGVNLVPIDKINGKEKL